ncbi:chemotaxis protein CheB [Arenimonas fontis]|uniref:protein-glutamate methylesterase n=1 Tax=Arenimonas fontis TaxID=2608255 RepID=A0A5B2ZAN0_9GAMM|nr:chemotaxis protein CheB [Arenimonas fontis]KAA2285156.1 hypothetical protein F0415_04345 [Arenimonas fontis]
MAEPAVRVALLARPGDARDQLRRALADLGAELVAEGDPGELDPDTVSGCRPSVVLVSLEPAVEEALERFDALLATPGIEVMYDDAEVTRQLDGWDLARWARHLAAKLVGGDVLPPPPGGADAVPEANLAPEPGAPRSPAEEMADARFEDHLAESAELAEWVPSEPSLAAAEVPDAPAATAAPAEPESGLDIDLGDLEQALGRIEADFGTSDEAVAGAEDVGEIELDMDLSALPEEGARLVVAEEPEPASAGDEPLLADLEIPEGPVDFSRFASDDAAAGDSLVDEDVAALAAQLEAFEAAGEGRQALPEPDFDRPAPDLAPPGQGPLRLSPEGPAGVAAPTDPVGLSLAEPESSPAAPAAATGKSLFGDLSLVPLEGESSAPSWSKDVPRGVLLVIAGLGGPDAVRQLLSRLPAELPLPVLLYQHLDTGKHDRLVGQLSKASAWPVDLAEAGKLALQGRVAVLPPGVGLRADESGARFTQGGELAAVVAALPAEHSGIVVLSGADPALVPAVLAKRKSGARVWAQDPGTCFDPAAAQAVIAEGAVAAAPAELPERIKQAWA